MSDKQKNEELAITPDENEPGDLSTRRDFLRSMGRWSAAIIGGATLASLAAPSAAGWINGGGGAWVNARGGGGGAWVNGGGGGWVNRAVGGGTWVNGGGGAWVNNRGGGGAWVNRF